MIFNLRHGLSWSLNDFARSGNNVVYAFTNIETLSVALYIVQLSVSLGSGRTLRMRSLLVIEKYLKIRKCVRGKNAGAGIRSGRPIPWNKVRTAHHLRMDSHRVSPKMVLDITNLELSFMIGTNFDF